MNFEETKQKALRSAERLQNDPDYLSQCMGYIFNELSEIKRELMVLRNSFEVEQ